MYIRSLLLCGAIAVAAWFLSSSTQDESESCHPFRSENAKQIYLAYYEERAKRVPGDGIMISTSFGDTHVRMSGPDNAPSVVLLPGDSETSLSWEPQLSALLEAGYRTYAVDNIYDYGKSVYSRHLKVPSDYVEWLEELFKGLEITSENEAHLVGFSYGGWLASMFAVEHSAEYLTSLVLIAPPATVIDFGWEIMLRGILQWTFPTRRIVSNYLTWYLPDSPPHDVQEIVDEVLISTSCFKRRGFVPPTVLTDDEWHQVTSQVPTLFVVGENEVSYNASKAIERLAQFDDDNITTRLIPNAGHDLRTIQADQVNHEILSFLSTTKLARW